MRPASWCLHPAPLLHARASTQLWTGFIADVLVACQVHFRDNKCLPVKPKKPAKHRHIDLEETVFLGCRSVFVSFMSHSLVHVAQRSNFTNFEGQGRPPRPIAQVQGCSGLALHK